IFLLQVARPVCYSFFFSSRRRHTRSKRDWSSDVCSSDLAWSDGVVTTEERRLLEQVAGSLGLTAADVTAALQTAEQGAANPVASGQLSASGITLRPGDRVTFTGAMQRGRNEWRDLAAAHGLVPGGVTKRTALVVAADPNS